MSYIAKIPWIQAQKNTFENWVNQSLKERNLHINDLQKDFKNSINLYALYQELTSKRIKHFDKKPKMKISCLLNLNLIIDAFKEEGVKIINVQGEDIYDETLKLILGFVWTLILHFHILGSEEKASKDGPKKILLQFVNSLINEPKISNFKGDWQNGRVLSELIEAIQPGSYPEDKRPQNESEMIDNALKIAEKELDVPKVIEAEYIIEAVDELSLMTYTTYLKKKHEKNMSIPHAENCIAYGKGLEDSENISPHEFTVELRNIYDEPCLVELERDPLKDLDVKVTGPRAVQFNSSLREVGFYDVQYDASVPGQYVIGVTLPVDGPQIKGSPFTVNISEQKMEISGNGFENSSNAKEENLTIDIDSKTKSGGLLEHIDVKVVGPSGNELTVKETDHEDGKYSFEYSPDKNGPHTISIFTFGKEMITKEVDLSLLDAQPINLHVTGELAEKKVFPNNRATGFTASVKTHDDQPVLDASLSVEITDSEGNAIETEIEEKENGDFEVNVDGIESKGDYNVTVNVNDEPKLNFVAKCVEGVQPEMVEGTFTFSVKAKDSKGEPKTTGGDEWEVDIKGPNDSMIEVETKDHGDGNYSATYRLAAIEGEESTFVVSALLDGRHVASSPFKHQLAPKPTIGARIKNFFKRS